MAPHNFDTERQARPRRSVEERTFILAGETFVARDRWRPEVMSRLTDVRDPSFDYRECSCGHPLNEHHPRTDGVKGAAGCKHDVCSCAGFRPLMTDRGSPVDEDIRILDETVLAMIEPGPDGEAHARYRALREDEDDPVEIEDLSAIVAWLTKKETGRPTGRPGGSTPGPPSTGTSSTDVSSSADSPEEPTHLTSVAS